MSNGTSPVVATLIVVAVLGTVLFAGIAKIARRAHAVTVIRQLRKSRAYAVHMGLTGTVWTPEVPPVGRLPMGFGQIVGRGVATYVLTPDGESVVLHWQPKSGRSREWTGPIPAVFARLSKADAPCDGNSLGRVLGVRCYWRDHWGNAQRGRRRLGGGCRHWLLRWWLDLVVGRHRAFRAALVAQTPPENGALDPR